MVREMGSRLLTLLFFFVLYVATFPVEVRGEEGAAASGYSLGPGDKLRVTVFGEESLSGEFSVGGDGNVSLPLIGEIRAGDRTITQLRDEVKQALGNGYLKDPRVSAEVITYRPYFILGEVHSPGQYPYSIGLTVLNAVATAGGFTYRADTDDVYIKKAGDSTERRYNLNQTVPILPGATIRIRERHF
jgi:protein involved in polysaccharide export with SLBB domain